MTNVTALKQEPDSSQLEIVIEKVSNATAEQVLEAISVLVEDRGANDFELGGYLSRVYEDKLMPDKINFSDWLVTQGIATSTGYRIKQAYEAVKSCDLPHDTFERVKGWSKLGLIATKLQPGDTEEAINSRTLWIGLAEQLNQKLLKEALAADKGKSKSDKSEPIFTHTLPLTGAQHELYSKAVESAKDQFGVKSEVDAIVGILQSYFSSESQTDG